MTRRRSGLGACIGFVLGATVFVAPTAGAIPRGACNQPIVVARLAFGPGTVHRGESARARLSGRNCTRHPRTVNITWTAKFSGNGAAGCPVIDPLQQKITVPATSALTQSLWYAVPAKCSATALTASARVTDAAGKLIRTKTASLRIIQPHTG